MLLKSKGFTEEEIARVRANTGKGSLYKSIFKYIKNNPIILLNYYYKLNLHTYKLDQLYIQKYIIKDDLGWFNEKINSSDLKKITFQGEIIVSEKNIPGNPYNANKEWVFERTFSKGIHGVSRDDYKEHLNKYKDPKNRPTFWYKKITDLI